MELSLAEIVTPNTLLHFPESQFLTLQNVKKNDYLMGLKKKLNLIQGVNVLGASRCWEASAPLLPLKGQAPRDVPTAAAASASLPRSFGAPRAGDSDEGHQAD